MKSKVACTGSEFCEFNYVVIITNIMTNILIFMSFLPYFSIINLKVWVSDVEEMTM